MVRLFNAVMGYKDFVLCCEFHTNNLLVETLTLASGNL